MTVFVDMYHPLIPSTAGTPKRVPAQAVDDYAARGWLEVDPADPPVVVTPYLTQAAGDSRYVRDTELAAQAATHVGDGSALDVSLRAAFALDAGAEPTDAKVLSFVGTEGTATRDELKRTFTLASARRREQRDRQRRGGAIGIGTVGAVAFRFDDWDDLVNGTLHPLMVARGLPYGHAQISRPLSRPNMCSDAAVWTKVIAANRAGREVWNHSATHTWSSGASITEEITTAHDEIVAATGGAVHVPGWCWPGCGNVGGVNITTGGGNINDWSLYDTAAAGLVERTYSMSEPVIPGTQHRVFPAGLFHGANTQTISEGGANLAFCKASVDEIVGAQTGVTFMLHAGSLTGIPGGTAGTFDMDLDDFIELLDYVTAYQAAGRLEVLSPSGMYYADHSSTRLNLEPFGDFERATQGAAPWQRWTATLMTDGGHSGSNYLRVGYTEGGVYRAIYSLNDYFSVGGQAYRFEAWVRSNSTGPNPGTAVPKVVLQNVGSNLMDLTASLPAVGTEWTKIRVPFVFHPDQNDLVYDIGRASGGDGVDFDDIRIVKV